ncbi:ribosome-associated heat shock protein Hsp15 [Agaribacter flavus]|uniref:Heat shock protein 15 n=1 Tax=Agaribacter flavus TaxID=1902781 RepID=A0ABV7FQN0_9ALTE
MSSQKQAQKHDTAAQLSVRLDKWLWAARFCKTRAIARDWVQAGKVHYNGQRSKPSKLVEVGATVRIPAGFDHKTVIISGLADKRVSANLAQNLYDETQESIDLREKNKQARQLSVFHSPRPDSRPDKKQRRQIIKIKHQD